MGEAGGFWWETRGRYSFATSPLSIMISLLYRQVREVLVKIQNGGASFKLSENKGAYL